MRGMYASPMPGRQQRSDGSSAHAKPGGAGQNMSHAIPAPFFLQVQRKHEFLQVSCSPLLLKVSVLSRSCRITGRLLLQVRYLWCMESSKHELRTLSY